MEKNQIIEYVNNARKSGKTYNDIVTEFNKDKVTTPKGSKFTTAYLYSFMTTNGKTTKKRMPKTMTANTGAETGNALKEQVFKKVNGFAFSVLNDNDLTIQKRVAIVNSFFEIYTN